MRSRGIGWIVAGFLVGCDTPTPSWDLERMMHQDRYRPYEASTLFEDGRAMRTPPAGVMAREPSSREPLSSPAPLGRALLERGRSRFEIHCAPCHGLRGDGASSVGVRMDLRRPPALVGGPDGPLDAARVEAAMLDGFGLMRSYAFELGARDRAAVVAYLGVLERARAVPMSALPPALRKRAEGALQ